MDSQHDIVHFGEEEFEFGCLWSGDKTYTDLLDQYGYEVRTDGFFNLHGFDNCSTLLLHGGHLHNLLIGIEQPNPKPYGEPGKHNNFLLSRRLKGQFGRTLHNPLAIQNTDLNLLLQIRLDPAKGRLTERLNSEVVLIGVVAFVELFEEDDVLCVVLEQVLDVLLF